MSEFKGVEVTTLRRPSDPDTFEFAGDISVKDGHLHVFGKGGDIVAIYAPGKWEDAEVKR